MSYNEGYHIGIDLGGTQIRCGLVQNGELKKIVQSRITAKGSAEEVLREVIQLTKEISGPSCQGIGIGVPGLVDLEEGVVYDVVNIPSWTRMELKQRMEEQFRVPVIINNDANCFALGEYYSGNSKGTACMAGLTIGTGLGCGIILDGRLYSGKNCGAGEFGMISYLDQNYEYYSSGQFFSNVYNRDGESVFKDAQAGDPFALNMYQEMGKHLGNAIKTILYALDIELVVLGGSVRQAFPYFSQAMWNSIRDFGFRKTLQELRIEVSQLENSGILGAAALCYEVT